MLCHTQVQRFIDAAIDIGEVDLEGIDGGSKRQECSPV
jgi:hypothetical protein